MDWSVCQVVKDIFRRCFERKSCRSIVMLCDGRDLTNMMLVAGMVAPQKSNCFECPSLRRCLNSDSLTTISEALNGLLFDGTGKASGTRNLFRS